MSDERKYSSEPSLESRIFSGANVLPAAGASSA